MSEQLKIQKRHNKENTVDLEQRTRKLKKSLSTVAQVHRVVEQLEMCESALLHEHKSTFVTATASQHNS